MLSNCIVCNTQIKSSPSEQKKYCSSKCYHARNGEKIETTCESCGKKFLAIPSHPRKYCSWKCQKGRKAWNRNKITKVCPGCGKKFQTIEFYKDKKKYCSGECYQKEHQANTWTTGICKGCGKEFRYMAYRKQTCCSLSCNAKYRLDKNNERQQVETKCQQCGKLFNTNKNRFISGRGKFCSVNCYGEWMSINRIGEKAPRWKGGITPLYKSIRLLAKYDHWRDDVKERDNYTCVLCGSKHRLIADHITSLMEIMIEFNITNTAKANACEELWNINNGRTLCEECHKKTPNYGERARTLVGKSKKHI